MTFNSWTFLFEVVNFLALVYILQRLLYRPLHDAIDRRRQAIEQSQAEAQRAEREAREDRQKLAEQLATLEETRQSMLKEARQEAEAERERILASAAGEAERRAELARDLIARERAEAWRSLQGELTRDATRLAERLIEEIGGEDLDSRLVSRLAETIRSLPQKERKELVQRWTGHEAAILEAAHGLNPGEVQPVRDALSELLGHDVVVRVQPAPDLASGVRLRLDGHVWDASLAGQMET